MTDYRSSIIAAFVALTACNSYPPLEHVEIHPVSPFSLSRCAEVDDLTLISDAEEAVRSLEGLNQDIAETYSGNLPIYSSLFDCGSMGIVLRTHSVRTTDMAYNVQFGRIKNPAGNFTLKVLGVYTNYYFGDYTYDWPGVQAAQ